MFTSINAVLKQLNAEGWNDITLEYINKGVMTDTYKMHTDSRIAEDSTVSNLGRISKTNFTIKLNLIRREKPGKKYP